MPKHSEEEDDDEPRPKKKRIAEPGVRHRLEKALAEVLSVPPPTPAELGSSHLYTHAVLAGGPKAAIAAEHEAQRLSAKFGEDIEKEWCLSTPWLNKLTATHPARARYALMWRPRLLAVISITRSLMLGCRAAKVVRNTVTLHRRQDPIFDKQIIAAEERAVELLHDVTWRDAVEGTCEPIFWQGIRVGHVRKFDNRLRVEMLRAHMPEKFKTPGARGSLISGDGNQILVCDDKTRNEIVALRQEALHDKAERMKRANAHVVEPLTLTEQAAN